MTMSRVIILINLVGGDVLLKTDKLTNPTNTYLILALLSRSIFLYCEYMKEE